jgi:hypothetical protein
MLSYLCCIVQEQIQNPSTPNFVTTDSWLSISSVLQHRVESFYVLCIITRTLKANMLLSRPTQRLVPTAHRSACTWNQRKTLQTASVVAPFSAVPPTQPGDTSAAVVNNGIERHGPGDAVIILNVGGQQFQTLRSTIASNQVLNEYICRAEANRELTEGKAVFIDRDPTHFAFILTFLRNRIEGVSYNSKWGKGAKYVQLPQDGDVIKHLYVEASHYRIAELQHQLCGQSLLVSLMASIGGGNPFEAATTWIKNLQRTALAFVGGGSIMTGLNLDLDDIPFLKKMLKTDVDVAKLLKGHSSSN